MLFLISSADTIELADGTSHETGFFAEEALIPYDRLTEAGVEVAVATPDGRPPHADSYGLEPIFHYPDDDEDFLLSIIRTFMHDVDDIRVTLRHLTELDLIAARRVFQALVAAGVDPETARSSIETAARTSWSTNTNFIDVLQKDPVVTDAVPTDDLAAAAAAVWDDAVAASRNMVDRLASIEGFQHPINLSTMSDEDVLGFDGIFIPGGHGPMVDMARNPDVGRALRLLNQRDRTIAALCHGPAALLAAGERQDGQWIFDGYKLTSFSDEEEDQTRVGKLGMPWFLETSLKNAGAVFDDAPGPWLSHVVVDRNLVTAQNPMSADAAAEAILKRLEVL
ncbi:MAG TPA: DJ-1/PfpI family protein [Acidimicrobiales bacterium]|jgi:putative intracellular protease/amidase|nr:DJ-1/PfpI family protein [Acidimicrobiales bacterium]